MLTESEWVRLDALAMAELVKKRQVSPQELVETAIARIQRMNGEVNAVVRFDVQQARQAGNSTQASNALFAGVPFLLKEVGPFEHGKFVSFCSRFFDSLEGTYNSTIVERYRAAGLINLGRTSSPELGLCPATEPALFGPCRNPWNLEHQSGGSSGGAAAAVAARMVPIAQGSDGGGSIRLPASHCGVYGLKPTRGRTPYGPVLGEGWGGFVSIHVLSLTVRDSAAALDATQGPAPGDPYAAPAPHHPYLDAIAAHPGRLKIAMVTTTASGEKVHPQVAEAVTQTATLLQSLGHSVEPFVLPFDEEACLRDFWLIVGANASALVTWRSSVLGRPPKAEELEPITRAIVEDAQTKSAAEYAAAMQRCHGLGRKMGEIFQRYDVILSPIFAAPPAPIGAFSMQQDDLAAYHIQCRTGMPFTWWFNVAGCPAASLPLGWSSDGLPIGVQVACAYGRDDLVLSVSAQLEAAQPWLERLPKLAVPVNELTNGREDRHPVTAGV